MSSHSDNIRLNSLKSIVESTQTEVGASNDAIAEAPSQTNDNTYQFSETATLIIIWKKR